MIMEINENDFKTIEKYNKIDGEAAAADIRSRLKELIAGENFVPKIVIIQVGNDFASTKYVNRKRKVAVELGIDAEIKHFEEDITEAQLLAEIDKVNGNDTVHGFIVQMPLPEHINTFNVLMHIRPDKDLDGLSPLNAGLLHYSKSVPYSVEEALSKQVDTYALGKTLPFIPCTPLGCLHLITNMINPAGKNAIVFGNSNLVGRPMARLLTQAGATTTTIHSRSRGVDHLLTNADIIVSATGAGIDIDADVIKPDAIIIDVAIRPDENGGICGDLNYKKLVLQNHITPVPKGVGPMTVVCLMLNSYLAGLAHN